MRNGERKVEDVAAVPLPGHDAMLAMFDGVPFQMGVTELTADEDLPAGSLGWKLRVTNIIGRGSFHGLLRLEDGRLHPITRDANEDVFKSSWVTFSR